MTQTQSKTPRVFISHAHEDKPFVTQLGTELRTQGIDAWVDQWEIKPGDSIIQKIFQEGLAQCQLFLVILSKAATQSKWVREELDHATIKRIEGTTRVVPILKEDCAIPAPLQTLLWLDMRTEFENGVRRLVNLAFGISEKPPIMPPPPHVLEAIESVGGLSRIASSLGKWLVDDSDEETGFEKWYSGAQIHAALKLTPTEINDAIDELESLGLVTTINFLGSTPYAFGQFQPTYALFIHFAEFLRAGYNPEEDARTVVAAVAAQNELSAKDLRSRTGIPITRLNRIVKYLEDYGQLDVLRYLGTAPYDFGSVHATRQTRQLAERLK